LQHNYWYIEISDIYQVPGVFGENIINPLAKLSEQAGVIRIVITGT